MSHSQLGTFRRSRLSPSSTPFTPLISPPHPPSASPLASPPHPRLHQTARRGAQSAPHAGRDAHFKTAGEGGCIRVVSGGGECRPGLFGAESCGLGAAREMRGVEASWCGLGVGTRGMGSQESIPRSGCCGSECRCAADDTPKPSTVHAAPLFSSPSHLPSPISPTPPPSSNHLPSHPTPSPQPTPYPIPLSHPASNQVLSGGIRLPRDPNRHPLPSLPNTRRGEEEEQED